MIQDQQPLREHFRCDNCGYSVPWTAQPNYMHWREWLRSLGWHCDDCSLQVCPRCAPEWTDLPDTAFDE